MEIPLPGPTRSDTREKKRNFGGPPLPALPEVLPGSFVSAQATRTPPKPATSDPHYQRPNPSPFWALPELGGRKAERPQEAQRRQKAGSRETETEEGSEKTMKFNFKYRAFYHYVYIQVFLTL